MMMIPSQSYFIFFLSLIFNALASPALQRNALLEFKNEFPFNAPDAASEAPSYTSLSSWNTSSSDHCSWKGVTCNANNSGEEEVISLVIENTFLNGSLKANTSLLKLQNLQHLTLSSCNLRGEIPSSLGNLTHLKHLEISSNHDLAGEIPSSIGDLFRLIFFSLHNNSLVGTIPSSLGNLSRLTNLDLSENHLIGEVPTSLFTILSLQEVSLRGNQFEGPLEFGNTTSSSSELNLLDLASNKFYGPIPEYISLFLKLKYLRLSHNSFIGTIPFSISKLASLKFLYLSYNNLEGQVPSFLWRLSILRLSHNSFTSLDTGSISNSLIQVSVFLIDLGSNSLGGSFPRWLCNCTSLYCLDLSNNHLTGSIPSCMTNCAASFRDINLRNNSLSGFLPDIFTSATSLQLLDVSHNQLTGKLPKSLINCKSMEYLNLKGNKIKDTFPSWLRSLVSLRVLFLGSNAFYGPLVSSRFGFPSLRVIDISNNNFDGTLPQDYFVKWHEMSNVVLVEKMEWYEVTMHKGSPYYRDLMDMMYKGVHTKFPRIFIAFKAIDFSGNKFTGRIPTSVGMLKALVHVNFSRNAFTGSIPSSLANLTNLEALDLSHNKLSGTIPSDLANLSFMSYFDFSHNFLQGPVPRSTQFQRQRCSSFEDNLGLFGLEEICGELIYAPPDPASGDSQKSEEFSSQESKEVLLNRIALAIAFGPGVLCGLVIGHIFFTSHKNKWFIGKFGRNYPPVAS